MKLVLFILIGIMINSINASTKIDKGKVVELKVKTDPTVSFKVWFKVGSQNDPAGKEGLAYITSQMINEGGTEKFSYNEILDKLLPMASSYSMNTTKEMTIFNGRTHKDNLDEYYDLFITKLLQPKFEENDLKRIKQNTTSFLKTTLRYSSDEELGKAVLYNSIFDGTRYGHIDAGTISSIESITLNDVKKFYAQYFNRNNFTLGIGGGYSDQFLEKVYNDLHKLPEGKSSEGTKINPKAIEGFDVTIVEKNAAATAISMGFPINILRGTKDWYALAIANSWLGEHRNSSSHLYQVIREARGLNYGDYSYIENFPNAGRLMKPPVNVARMNQIFEIWIRPVPNETKHFALRAALREFKAMLESGLSEDEFQLTKNFLKKYVLHYAPSTSMQLGYAIDDRYYGLNESHLSTFRKMMDEITLADVNNAIKKYLQYDNMKIVFITNDAAKLKDDLANNETSPITYSSPKPQHILDEDIEIIDFKLSIDKNKISIVPVEELFK